MRRLVVCAVAMWLLLATAPGAAALAEGTDRPVWSYQTGEINFLRNDDPACPIRIVADGYGTMDHLGSVWTRWTACSFGGPDFNEVVTITAANGDTLFGTWEAGNVTTDPLDITGGTGRFAGATGHLDVTAQVSGPVDANGWPISPWHGTWLMQGTISY